MWKLACMSSCLLFYVLWLRGAESVPVPGHGALEGYCDSNNPCTGTNECCASFDTMPGESALRKVKAMGLRDAVDGYCDTQGKPGVECLVRDFSSLVADIHYHACPCSGGYTCKGNGQLSLPLGELGTCVKQCSSSADCGRFECCVSTSVLRGKRSADRVTRQVQGQCKPMGKRGSECLVRNGSGKPDGIVFHSCPCGKSKTCVGTGMNTVPLGELGKCRKIRG